MCAQAQQYVIAMTTQCHYHDYMCGYAAMCQRGICHDYRCVIAMNTRVLAQQRVIAMTTQ